MVYRVPDIEISENNPFAYDALEREPVVTFLGKRSHAASSRNLPKRLRGGSMPRLSAVGVSGLKAGEDVNVSASGSCTDPSCAGAA